MKEDEMSRRMEKALEVEKERIRKLGKVGPVIAARNDVHRFLAVGSRVYYGEWQTFIDFLLFYVSHIMGEEWWQDELKKPTWEQNPMVRWRSHVAKRPENRVVDERGLVTGIQDGPMTALLLLAYDLYVLRNHSKLHDEVVTRLRNRFDFPGARYELFVAATFIRVGADITFHDETDNTKKHPEFDAVHKEFEMSVEAKARTRHVRGEFDMASIRPGVDQHLRNAADKGVEHPLVVFLELNLPPEPGIEIPTWVPHVDEVAKEIVKSNGGSSPFGAIVFTNRPHLYGEEGAPDPTRFALLWVSLKAAKPVPIEIATALHSSVQQYGNLPDNFPPEWGDPKQ